jgi:hypothetical protein
VPFLDSRAERGYLSTPDLSIVPLAIGPDAKSARMSGWRAAVVGTLLSLCPGPHALAQATLDVDLRFATPTEARPIEAPAVVAFQPADLLLDTIVTWLANNFELPAIYDHPRIAFGSPGQIGWLRYGASGADGGRTAMGVYLDNPKTIYLPLGWTGRAPADLSVLVHEMVHHLQNLGKLAYFCPEAREKLAYEAQEKWLGLFGRSLLQDFQVDAMTLMVATSCM